MHIDMRGGGGGGGGGYRWRDAGGSRGPEVPALEVEVPHFAALRKQIHIKMYL